MSPAKQPRAAAAGIGGPIVVATLLIVISFLASLVFSQFRLKNIEQRAFMIFEDALPSMEHLANLRTELHRLGMYVSEYVSRDALPSRSDISDVRKAIEHELQAYQRKTLFPEERRAIARIERELAGLDEVIGQTIELTGSGPRLPAQQWLLQNVHARVERVDDAILGLRHVQVRLVRLDTERILAAREASQTLALVMGTGSLVLALLVSAFVVMTLRERVRLLEANDRLMLQHANRLATVGQLAAGIAHELGSPLQVVAGRAKMISTGRSEGESAREAGSVILGQAQRMTKIIRGRTHLEHSL